MKESHELKRSSKRIIMIEFGSKMFKSKNKNKSTDVNEKNGLTIATLKRWR